MKDKIYEKVKHNSKIPVESNWQNNPVGKKEIEEWIKKGGNRAILYSDLTGLCCVDVDYPDKFPLRSLIDSPDTTAVKTNKGYHFIYKRPEGLQNMKFEWGDFLYQNKQGVIPPSIVNGVKRKFLNKMKPAEMSKALLSILNDNIRDNIQDNISENDNICDNKSDNIGDNIGLNIQKGARNDTFTHIAGVLRKTIPEKYIYTILSLFNRFIEKPLSQREIKAIAGQMNKYNLQDITKVSDAIYEILVDPMNLKDLHLILTKEGFQATYRYVQQAVNRLSEQNKVFRISRGVYRSTKPTQTANIMDFQQLGLPVPYRLPLKITEIADIYPNNVLLIASKAGNGKTHVFAHIIKALLEQGIPCSYWDMENDIDNIVHIFKKYIPADLMSNDMLLINKEDVSIESLMLHKDRVNFVDPIYVEDGWGEVDNLMRRLKKQLQGGLCFIATHVKDMDGRVFGGATAMKVPSFVMELKHNGDRFHPKFKILKVRNWKPNCKVKEIEAMWDDEKGLITQDDNVIPF